MGQESSQISQTQTSAAVQPGNVEADAGQTSHAGQKRILSESEYKMVDTAPKKRKIAERTSSGSAQSSRHRSSPQSLRGTKIEPDLSQSPVMNGAEKVNSRHETRNREPEKRRNKHKYGKNNGSEVSRRNEDSAKHGNIEIHPRPSSAVPVRVPEPERLDLEGESRQSHKKGWNEREASKKRRKKSKGVHHGVNEGEGQRAGIGSVNELPQEKSQSLEGPMTQSIATNDESPSPAEFDKLAVPDGPSTTQKVNESIDTSQLEEVFDDETDHDRPARRSSVTSLASMKAVQTPVTTRGSEAHNDHKNNINQVYNEVECQAHVDDRINRTNDSIDTNEVVATPTYVNRDITLAPRNLTDPSSTEHDQAQSKSQSDTRRFVKAIVNPPPDEYDRTQKPSEKKRSRMRQLNQDVEADQKALRGQKTGNFTPDEKIIADGVFYRFCRDERTTEADLKNKMANWRELNSFKSEMREAFPLRTETSIRKFCKRRYHPFDRGPWTEGQDADLKGAYKKNPDLWATIGVEVGRLPEDCRDRYRNYLLYEGRLQTGPWSEQEEELLTNLVEEAVRTIKQQHPRVTDRSQLENWINWKTIAEGTGGKRSKKRCLEKWQLMKKRGGNSDLQSGNAVYNSPSHGSAGKGSNSQASTGPSPSKLAKAQTLENSYNNLKPGDVFDLLMEIYMAIKDDDKNFYDDTTLWSLVATNTPQSRFKSNLRRRVYSAALERWPPKNTEQKRGIASNAKRFAKKIKKFYGRPEDMERNGGVFEKVAGETGRIDAHRRSDEEYRSSVTTPKQDTQKARRKKMNDRKERPDGLKRKFLSEAFVESDED